MNNQGHIVSESCICSVCKIISSHPQISCVTSLGNNSLVEWLTILPSQFPIWIVPTIINSTLYYTSVPLPNYSTKNKATCKMVTQKANPITFFKNANLMLYYKDSSKIMPRYKLQTNKKQEQQLLQNVCYMQAYVGAVAICVRFKENAGLDVILQECVQKQVARFDQSYAIKEQLLQWVYSEYGRQILCSFWTRVMCKLLEHKTGNKVLEAIFYYVITGKYTLENPSTKSVRNAYRNGTGYPIAPKIINVTHLKIKYLEKYYSFQQQFQDHIRKKIKQENKDNKDTRIKTEFVYNNRLSQFRSKIKSVFNKQQSKIMSQVQQQKQFQYQHDTEKMAKLLIPSMAPYQSLREVLNNQEAFMNVFFKSKTKKKFNIRKTKQSNF